MRSTITDNGVSSGARHLFHILKDFARGKNWPECWPRIWRLSEETGKSRRMVLYYLLELEKWGAIERVRTPGKGGKYRILIAVNERLNALDFIAPVQPIALLPVQPIAPVGVSSIIEEATSKQAAHGIEIPAAAAEENSLEKEMQKLSKNCFEELVSLGMPASTEASSKIALCPDFARDVLRHCKRRFGNGKKPVDNPGGYIAALLNNPAKFGWVQRDGVWCDPEKPSGPSADELLAGEVARKAANRKDAARRQAEADKAYADMKAAWEFLPEEAKKEIVDFVKKESPLFHKGGLDAAEFELACMNEATAPGREKWRRCRLGLPPMKNYFCSQRG